MPSPISKLLTPRFPVVALGLESSSASVVQLERGRNGFALRRAATMTLPPDLIIPSFDESNITDPAALVEAISDLVTNAGLLRQRRWSVALPESAARTVIMSLESAVNSRRELEEVLEWKVERGFGVPAGELRVARKALAPDANGRARYVATGVRLSVLQEYEAVFQALGWSAGLVLPRHVGEERWLIRNGHQGDSLLLTSHDQGFTSVLLRDNQPLLLRSVLCEPEDCDDELYRVLLFYRDRGAGAGEDAAAINRLLVLGESFSKTRVADIVNETLGTNIRPLNPADLGLTLPEGELSFDRIAAPAGLATLAWA
jgi:hypothetical protein